MDNNVAVKMETKSYSDLVVLLSSSKADEGEEGSGSREGEHDVSWWTE